MSGLIHLGSGQPTSVAPPEDVEPKLVRVPGTPGVAPSPAAPLQLVVPVSGPRGQAGQNGQNGQDGHSNYDDMPDLTLKFENALI